MIQCVALIWYKPKKQSIIVAEDEWNAGDQHVVSSVPEAGPNEGLGFSNPNPFIDDGASKSRRVNLFGDPKDQMNSIGNCIYQHKT